MKAILRSPMNWCLAVMLLVFLICMVMGFTTQQRAITTQQKLATLIQDNETRLYAANREATIFHQLHGKETASADDLRQQNALDAELVRLKAVEDGLLADLLATSQSAQSFQKLYWLLGPMILLPLSIIVGRAIAGRRKKGISGT